MENLSVFLENPATTVKQMRDLAREKNINLHGITRKADIANAIKSASKIVTETVTNSNVTPETSANFSLDRVLLVKKPLMRGKDVEAVQAALIAKGYHVGASGADGIFTASTAKAVRHFQAANGFIVNGKVASQTAAALGAEWKGK